MRMRCECASSPPEFETVDRESVVTNKNMVVVFCLTFRSVVLPGGCRGQLVVEVTGWLVDCFRTQISVKASFTRTGPDEERHRESVF